MARNLLAAGHPLTIRSKSKADSLAAYGAIVANRAAPIFAALGRATLVGPAGSGQLAKLANQAIVAVTIGAVAEALLLAAAGGAADHQVTDCTTIVATAKATGLTLPFAETALALFRDLVAHGGARYDHSALILELERRNAPAPPRHCARPAAGDLAARTA